MHEDDKAEIQRILDLLRILIRISGLSNREVERRLKLSPSYLSRLFGGYLEVKLEHVLGISRALGLKPAEFFEFAYPEGPLDPSEAYQRIRGVLHTLQPNRPEPPPPPKSEPAITAEEVERRIQEALRQVFRDLQRSA
jgi:transcriptional regulator with XRE-family HTH domain